MACEALQHLLEMQEVRGSREWAEQQIRLIEKHRRPMTVKRINTFLVANGYREVR